MRSKRRDKTEVFVEFSSDGSFNLGIVVDGLKDSALEAMLSAHAAAELGEAAVEKKECANTQHSIKNGQSEEGLLFAFDDEHLMRYLNLFHLFNAANRVSATRRYCALFVSGHEATVLATTKRKTHSMLGSMKHTWMDLGQATGQAVAMFIALGLCLGHCILSVLNQTL